MKYEDHGYYLDEFMDFRPLVGEIPVWELVDRVSTFIESNPDRGCRVCGKGFKHHDSVDLAPLFAHLDEKALNLVSEIVRDFELTYDEAEELTSSRARSTEQLVLPGFECEGSPDESCSLVEQKVESHHG